MSDTTRDAQRTAACIAFAHIDEASAREREHVLVALIDVLPELEAKLAQDMLFHLREERRLQFELALVLDTQRTAKDGFAHDGDAPGGSAQ